MNPGVFVAIGGSRDGLGKTTFCVNLAISVQREVSDPVLYLDLDLDHCGDGQQVLGMDRVATIASLIGNMKGADHGRIAAGITTHPAGRCHVLKLYDTPRELDQLDQSLLGPFFKYLRTRFRFIFLDAGATFTAFNLKAYELSSLIFFLVSPEVMVLNEAPARLADFQAAQLSKNIINIIFNRYQHGGAIDPAIVGKKLQKEVLLTIPFEPGPVEKSLYDASPAVLSQPRSQFTACINQLSAFLLKDSVLRKLRQPNPEDGIDLATLRLLNRSLAGLEMGAGSGSTADLFKLQSKEEFDRETEFKLRVHRRLIELMDLKKIETEAEAAKDEKKVAELWDRTRAVINRIIDELGTSLDLAERKRYAKEVLDEALGLGPLEDLIADPDINEIMVNRKDQLYVEKGGKLLLTNLRFTSDKHLRGVIDRIVQPTGRRTDDGWSTRSHPTWTADSRTVRGYTPSSRRWLCAAPW